MVKYHPLQLGTRESYIITLLTKYPLPPQVLADVYEQLHSMSQPARGLGRGYLFVFVQEEWVRGGSMWRRQGVGLHPVQVGVCPNMAWLCPNMVWLCPYMV